jgi:hypothetical protein
VPDITLHPPSETDTLPECASCGTRTDETWLVSSGREVCNDCLNSYYVYCDRCNEYVRDYCANTYSSGETVCDPCAQGLSTCDDCGGLTDETYPTVAQDTICYSCTIHSYWVCGACGEYVSNDNHVCPDCGDDDDDDYCCDECSRSRSSGLINSYSYKPLPEFHGTGPAFFGLELEVEIAESVREAAQIAADHLGTVGYLKSDSTINRGFEIVTHPMSYEYAAESFPWDMLTALRDAGADTHDEVGLHIHVSRAAFDGPAHVYRWLKFLHRNNDAVRIIARRDSDQWAPWSREDRHAVKDHAKGRGRSYASRYSAINVTNAETFEVRVFRSTLVKDELRAALDLMAASVEYTRTLTVQDITQRDGWSWKAFAAWVAERPEYAALANTVVEV